jgi:hypothetical protein
MRIPADCTNGPEKSGKFKRTERGGIERPELALATHERTQVSPESKRTRAAQTSNGESVSAEVSDVRKPLDER